MRLVPSLLVALALAPFAGAVGQELVPEQVPGRVASGSISAPRVQREVMTGGSEGSAVCWHARPMPRCKIVFLTDFSVDFSLAGRRFANGTAYRQMADWGLVFSTGPRDAVGATFFTTLESGGVRAAGPAFRYKRWFDQKSSLDLSVGVLVVGDQERGSVFGLVEYRPAHWIGVALRPEIVRGPCLWQLGGACPRTRIAAGVVLGWVPGGTLAMVSAVAALLWAASGGMHFTAGL
jgi:hypothetical protein